MDVSIRIVKWEKHNPRKDVKRPSWFALDNSLVEDDDFYKFNHGEFKTWIYILSKASKKQSGIVLISFDAASRKANISTKDFKGALEKLKALGMVTVDVTPTLRTRHADVTLQTDKQTNITDTTDTQGGGDPDFSLLANLWNEHCGDLPRVKKMNPERIALSHKRIQEEPSQEVWVAAIVRLAASEFCCGVNERGWLADFDFLLQASTLSKTIEGKYDNRKSGTSSGKAQEPDWNQEAEYFVQAVQKIPQGESEKLKTFLGDQRFEWFLKIGRRRIAEMPNNEFARKDLARLIKSYAQQTPEVSA